ncbi:MAG TPA: U32 family peptidase [Usitatibacteraceae bacterium]|nr:U32 family peptidase [Usitatibacteraceae bacterium]
MKLTLGPLLYYWKKAHVEAFYEEIADTAVDTVHLGEAVCGKRHELRFEDWMAIARRLANRGKEVVLSTCELIESETDLRVLRRVAENGAFMVEANDLGAVNLLAGKGPYVAGPYLNIYSGLTLDFHRRQGAVRWVPPVELGASAVGRILADYEESIETEVFAYGRLPLAISARCFTARYNNQSKDDCGFRCIEHSDGMTLSTQDDRPFLALNGLQTQSAHVQNLAASIAQMRDMGVGRLRISPQSQGTAEVIRLFRRIADGELDGTAALGQMPVALGEAYCNGFWHGRPGLERH